MLWHCWRVLKGAITHLNLFEAATIVYEGVIVFVKVLLLVEGVDVYLKVAFAH